MPKEITYKVKVKPYKKKSRYTWQDKVGASAYVVGYKTGKPCMDCKGVFPDCCMDFDHLPGEIKLSTIAVLVNINAPIEIIQAEIDKCDLVCSNCHRIRTRNRKRQKVGN